MAEYGGTGASEARRRPISELYRDRGPGFAGIQLSGTRPRKKARASGRDPYLFVTLRPEP